MFSDWLSASDPLPFDSEDQLHNIIDELHFFFFAIFYLVLILLGLYWCSRLKCINKKWRKPMR